MKALLSLNITRRDLNVFIACLLSFSILMMPFVPVAAASGLRERQSRTSRGKSSPASTTMNVTAANAPLPAPAPEPFVPSITATKAGVIIGDDGDGKADPNPSPAAAEKIEYTVTISNAAGATDATGVTFMDTIDAHTTLVPNSVNTQPIADPDTYTASGNIGISIGTGAGVLANDRDPDTGNNTGLTVTAVQGVGGNVGVVTNTNGVGRGGVTGKVTLASNGSFTYEPPPGFNGADTFTYTVSDGTLTDNNITVTINISQLVWFIQNNAGGSNIGTFSNPFTSIASFNTANAAPGTAPNPKDGDFVVLRTGSGTYAEADGVNLRNLQKLIGNGIAFNSVFTADANSIAAYGTFAGSAGTAPIITPSAGNGVDLASNNTVIGLNVGNSSGFKINGGAVGMPIINTVNLTGTGGALNIATSGVFGSNVTFGTFESTSSVGSNVSLVNVTGTLAVTTTGTGLSGSAAANAGVSINGGSVIFSYPGAVSKTTTGAAIQVSGGHTGSLTFGGTVSANAGTGLQFDNADGTYNFSGTTNLAGGDAGIDILNGSGGMFTFGANTTITSPSGSAFNVSTGTPNVTYSGNITQNSAARVVNIDGTTGSGITFNTGTITGGVSSTGININNTSGNVTFSNGMTLGTSGARMTNQAVTITNGGSGATYALGAVSIFTTGAQGIVATDFDGTLNATGTVDTTAAAAGATAAAININGPVGLTTLGLSFLKVASNNSTNGILVQDTNGSFTVTGTGSTDGSGGTISNITNRGASFISATTISLSNMTFTNAGTANGADPTLSGSSCGSLLVGGNAGCNAAIHLQSTTGVTLTNVDISGGNQEGINGNNVTNFSLSNSTVNNVGNEVREDGLRFLNMLGTNSITNSSFTNNEADQIHIENNTGVLGNSVTASGLTVSSTGLAAAPNGSHGFVYFGSGTANFDISVTNSTFNNLFSNSIHTDSNSSGVTEVTITGNTFTNVGASGVTMAQDGSGAFRFNISNNGTAGVPTFLRGTNTGSSHSINVNQAANAPQSAVMEGQITNNFIGDASSSTSANTGGNGIRVLSVAPGTLTVLISGNTTRGTGANGIQVQMSEDTNANHRMNATVTNNNATVSDVNSFDGFIIQAGALTGDVGTMCLDLVNNDGSATAGGNDFTVRQRFGTTVQLPGYTGAANSPGQVQTFLDVTKTNDPLGAGNDWFITNNVSGAQSPAGFGFVNTPGPGNPCPQPTLPSAPVSKNSSPNKQLQNYAQHQAPQQSNSDAAAQTVAVSATQVAAESSQPSLFARALNAVANFAGAVHSLIEPSAQASAETPRSEYVAAAVANENRPVEVKATTQPVNNSVRKAVTSKAPSRTVSNHARSNRIVARNATAMTPMVAGETVNVNIGTLRPDDSVVIKFQVTVNNPPNLTLLNPARVRNGGSGINQAKVSGTNFSDVFTNEVDTNVDLFDTQTAIASNLNPSNFGDQVTFTATVTENPGVSAVDPTGTVDFIDTSNGNAVVCDNVTLTAGQAQCQTSTLTAGTHNIRADYSGDGNFDPSQSGTVAQVVIACVSNPIVTSTGDAGAGSLREAVSQVCNGTTITFNIADAGPHTITLTTGELAAAKNMTIKNNSGESIIVSGNNASRVFNINSGKTVSIIGLTLSGGNAASGGAVLNDGALTIVNSTLSGNTATGDGGAISTTATGTALTLINATLSGNHANGSGGGLVTLGGTVSIINSTITNNTADFDNNSTGTGGGIHAQAGTVTLKNTIVAGNLNADGGPGVADDISGTVDTTAAASFNLIGTGGAGGLMNGSNNNQVGVANAGLGSLADNGGVVFTHALLSTSAAVETGGNGNLPADTFDLDGDADLVELLPVDGRGLGFPRNADSQDANTTQTVDIGAFELHPSIEDIANQTTDEDTVKNVPFNIGDDTGSLIAMVVATSSNTTLVPNANLIVSGSGGSRNLQITPAANQIGTTTITVTVTATNNRTAVDTFDLTVNAVNDPPSGTDNTVSTAEDTVYTFTAADFGFTDPNDTPPNSFLAVKITTLPGLGTLTNNNVPVNAGDSVLVSDINGGLLKFTPAPDGFGTPYTTFTFQVQDAGGGTDLDPTPNTMTINVTGVNDAPVNTVPGPQSTDEDVPLVFSGGNGNQISVADSDAGSADIRVTLTATNGTITLGSIPAGLSFTVGDGTADATMTFDGTLTEVNTAMNGMSFTGTANFSGAASLQIVSNDLGNTGSGGPLSDTDSVNITINALNDPPSGTDNTVSTAEDTAYTFTTADFGFSDPNDTPPNTLQAVKITTLPGLGTLTNNNNPVNAGDLIPVADINGGLLKFTPAADGNGTPYTTFTFQVQDNGGGTDLDPTPNTMTINVTAVNDAPVNMVPGPQNTTEDTPKVFSSGTANQISVADVDAGSADIRITLTATNGTITLGSIPAGLSFTVGDGTADATMTFEGSLTEVNTAMNGMTYNPDLDFTGAASLQIVSNDLGNTGSGGALSDTDTVNITVNAANDAPIVTTSAGNLSYTENDPPTAIDPGLTVTDVDDTNLEGATVTITSGFVAGQDTLGFTTQNGITGMFSGNQLTLTGTSSVANYETALRSVTYANSSDNPTGSRTVTFIADDGSSTSAPATKAITINAVNDAPVNTVPGGQSTNQNTPLTFSAGNGNQISVADADAGSADIRVTLTATNGTITLGSIPAGLSFSVGDGMGDVTMTFDGTLTEVNTAMDGMTYTPNMGFSGAATLTITSNDLGNSGSGGPLSDTDVVNIQVATEVRIQDASVAEPKSGSVNMIFTVTLSAPAPAGGSSVDFTTVELAPALNHATAGDDYQTTNGTVSFSAGEQFKTILVPVFSDNKKSEANESFEVQLSNPVNLTIADGTATGTIIENEAAGAVLISELRTSGPGGAGDDFVEIYNNSDSAIVVTGTNGGYGLFKMGATCSDTPVLLGVIPNGTTIPRRGHFLFTGSAYSLADYGGTGVAAGDLTMLVDIESDRNVALFSTGTLATISSANRLDAVGFGANTGGTCDLFREGNTLTPLSGSTLQYTFFRDECGKKGNPSTFGPCPTGGLTKDSNVNADDFIFADTNATATVAGQRLGAPGPQNLGSPRYTTDILALLLDSTKSASGSPNRVRDTMAVGPNAAQGTMSIRRRFQNNTGAPVTRLRIRVVDISTTFVSGGVADLRLLSSGNVTVSVNDPATCTAAMLPTPCNITVVGTTLETPPAQPLGGGFNSSATTGTITLGTPLAPGASVNLQLLLGVQSSGSFKFFFNVEALP